MPYATIEKRREWQNCHYHKNNEKMVNRQRLWRENNRHRYTDYHRKYKRKIRIEVLKHYGNGICACISCGESRLPCLTIDHINGKGSEHRKSEGMKVWAGNIYGFLRKQNYPSGYQTLCMNCNFIKWAIDRGDKITMEEVE